MPPPGWHSRPHSVCSLHGPRVQYQVGFEPMSRMSPCQALLGDQYGPCLVPQRIEEKEWKALRAQLTSRPQDLELVARHFRRDDNAIPPTYLLQPPGSVGAPEPEEATLTSVLQGGAQEAWRLGLINQEQWKCYHRSGELQGTPRASCDTGNPRQHTSPRT